MDFFGERILATLKDRKPRDFNALLAEVGFTHNTLQQHLQRLQLEASLLRRKWLQTTWETQIHLQYSVHSIKTGNECTSKPMRALVTLQFSRLRHLCRFEKGGHCKPNRDNCRMENCPLIMKPEIKSIKI